MFLKKSVRFFYFIYFLKVLKISVEIPENHSHRIDSTGKTGFVKTLVPSFYSAPVSNIFGTVR